MCDWQVWAKRSHEAQNAMFGGSIHKEAGRFLEASHGGDENEVSVLDWLLEEAGGGGFACCYPG